MVQYEELPKEELVKICRKHELCSHHCGCYWHEDKPCCCCGAESGKEQRRNYAEGD